MERWSRWSRRWTEDPEIKVRVLVVPHPRFLCLMFPGKKRQANRVGGNPTLNARCSLIGKAPAFQAGEADRNRHFALRSVCVSTPLMFCETERFTNC